MDPNGNGFIFPLSLQILVSLHAKFISGYPPSVDDVPSELVKNYHGDFPAIHV